jgi:hypothetical protein
MSKFVLDFFQREVSPVGNIQICLDQSECDMFHRQGDFSHVNTPAKIS